MTDDTRDTPRQRDGVVHHFTIMGEQELDGYLTINKWDGKVQEVFVAASKQGGTLRGMVDSLAIMTSNALQYGMPLYKVSKALIGITFEPKGMTNDPEVPWCSSVSDYVGRKLAHHLTEEERDELGVLS